MTEPHTEAPLAEQEICVNCGLCCDGSLFRFGILQPGEKENLPEKIEQNYGKKQDKEYFTLPCLYFCGSCTIYNQKKPSICSGFRCTLLINFSKNSITLSDAKKAVETALKYREDIYKLYHSIFGIEYSGSFRELIDDLPGIYRANKDNDLINKQVDLFILKCGLYDTLLTKTFKTKKLFESLLKESME